MTIRKAVAKLLVTLVSLFTAVLSLVAALVRLSAAGVLWAAARIESHIKTTPAAKVSAAKPVGLHLVPAVESQPAGQAERLVAALTGIGFRAPNVRAFATSLGEKVETAPLPDLIKEGLRVLAPANITRRA